MSYHLDFTHKANDDIESLKKSGNKAVLTKLLTLFEELIEHPYTGTGKPEPLKHSFTRLWSRRINLENRLIYQVTENVVIILSTKGHYE